VGQIAAPPTTPPFLAQRLDVLGIVPNGPAVVSSIGAGPAEQQAVLQVARCAFNAEPRAARGREMGR
jgi:hypothetical protein